MKFCVSASTGAAAVVRSAITDSYSASDEYKKDELITFTNTVPQCYRAGMKFFWQCRIRIDFGFMHNLNHLEQAVYACTNSP